MIESKIIKYLNSALSVPAYAEKPEKPGKQYVIIERVGGSETNRICDATISIRAIGSSLLDAAKLSEQVKTAMDDFDTVGNVSGVYLNAETNLTNPQTREYRYQTLYRVYYMED